MRVALVSILAACAFAGVAAAQAPPAPAPTSDAALAEKLAHDAEIADQDRRSEASYDKAQADYAAALAAHDAEVAKLRADADRAQADYAKAKAAWEAKVAACKAGDVKSCQAS